MTSVQRLASVETVPAAACNRVTRLLRQSLSSRQGRAERPCGLGAATQADSARSARRGPPGLPATNDYGAPSRRRRDQAMREEKPRSTQDTPRSGGYLAALNMTSTAKRHERARLVAGGGALCRRRTYQDASSGLSRTAGDSSATSGRHSTAPRRQLNRYQGVSKATTLMCRRQALWAGPHLVGRSASGAGGRRPAGTLVRRCPFTGLAELQMNHDGAVPSVGKGQRDDLRPQSGIASGPGA